MFEEFPKIARLSRECVVTEKIDGTNAQVHILSAVDAAQPYFDPSLALARHDDGRVMLAGSRSRYIVPAADNHGWAAWVRAHADELWALGEGRHFGEWWGSGIQRGYGLRKGEKRFSLFNVARWADERDRDKFPQDRPACCSVVPTLHRGRFSTNSVHAALSELQQRGSFASPGFMNPEGVVVFHEASRQLFKKTIERDEEPKSKPATTEPVTAAVALAPVIVLLALLVTSCDKIDNPTAPTRPPTVTAPVTPVTLAPNPTQPPVVITYAQGTSSGSLHVQWTGSRPEYRIEVAHAISADAPFTAIASFPYERQELQWYPPTGPGRYQVTVSGTVSRVMFLEGSDETTRPGDGGGAPPDGDLGDGHGSSGTPPVSTDPPPPVTPPKAPTGDHDKGHGNDDDRRDEDNPGKKRGSTVSILDVVLIPIWW